MSNFDPKDEDKTSVLTSETLKVHLDNADKTPPTLVLLVGPASSIGKQWSLEGDDIVIGRSPTSTVFVDDRSISKSHAKFILQGEETYIMDLDSTNKTVINSKPVAPLTTAVLKNNDQIKTGNVIFKFLERGNIEAVSNKKTFDRTQIDSMTGAYNKGALLAYAPEAIKRSDLLGIPISVIVFDIDHFKKVNDTYGHAAGDFVINEIAKLVKDKLTRSEDFFSRFGGEEFVLVLSGTPRHTAADIAERIRASVEGFKFEYENVKLPITISLGVATRDAGGDPWDMLFEKADQALYKSKKRGRNQVSIG
ncbi:MAG: GGDEF domain-containing protein [Bdellovibrionaceae bacterium]|nr:GGDEF domain-containing protein [Pseudobdellovibrionaceae bacterium]